MEEGPSDDQVITTLIGEFKEVRRVGGFPLTEAFLCQLLIGEIVNHSQQALVAMLVQWRHHSEDHRKMLPIFRNIFTPSLEATREDLTTRRRRLAEELGVNERTVARTEDKIIEELAATFLSVAKSDEAAWARVQEFYKGTKNRRTSDLYADDLPGIVHVQSQIIEGMSQDLVMLRKMNQKLLRMLGG